MSERPYEQSSARTCEQLPFEQKSRYQFLKILFEYCVFLSLETGSRSIKANDAEYNDQFEYAVISEIFKSIICFIHLF